MKKITLFLEDDFFEILQDFKKNALKNPKTSDEKAMTLMTRYFMETFNSNFKKITSSIMTPTQLTKHYFEVSNKSDFTEIEKLFAENTTYSSQNTGLYLGIDDIVDMQRNFHRSFEKLEWKVGAIEEEKPGIVRADFDFIGVKEGETIEFSGIEYVVVVEGKIQHIEIRNK